MSKFSERIGKTAPRSFVQLEEMDEGLRNGLWNAFILSFPSEEHHSYKSAALNTEGLLLYRLIWGELLKLPLDTIPREEYAARWKLREWYMGWEWFAAYDFIEFIATQYKDAVFVERCNVVLESEKSAYRFAGLKLLRITNETEVQSVAGAAQLGGDRFAPVALHIQLAIAHFGNRKNPDYRNSIKESISAVEALVKIVTGSRASGVAGALKTLEESKVIHGAMKASFIGLYGYSSDENGIRHAMLDVSAVDEHDARFMLVACSAFVNFVAAKLP